jgi:hypothetical protein
MNLLQELVIQIERLKLLKDLDWECNFTSWYDGEVESLSQTLTALLKQP